MVVAARTGNEVFPESHYHLSPQTASTLPPSNGLAQSQGAPESNTEAGAAAYSNCFWGCCPPVGPWVTSLDVLESGPAAQAVAPQMNTVTPYVGGGNDGGGSPVGAGVCAESSPTRKIKITRGARRTASIPGRNDIRGCHRSPHRAMGYDQTCPRVPSRQTTQTGRSGAIREPAVRFEADVDVLSARLLREGADNIAVKLLCTQVFNSEVSAKALMAKSMQCTSGASSMRSKYHLFLVDLEREDGSSGHCCLLCPQGRRKEYKNPLDSVRHLYKAHFGFALPCSGAWYVVVYKAKTQSKES